MARKLFHLFVFTALCLALFGLNVAAIDSRNVDTKANTLRNYGFSNDARVDDPSTNWDKNPTNGSLGSYSVDGGSPGYIIGRSYRDDQAHINPGNFIDWGSDARMHFIYAAQVCGGYDNPNSCARWINYNMFDPTISPGGVFISGATGIPVQPSPLSEGGHFPQMVLSETDRIIIAGEALDPNDADAWAPWTKLWWDISPSGIWGTFVNDTLPMTTVTDAGAHRYQQPRIDRQEFGGNYVLHVVSLFGDGATDGGRELYYHRKVAAFSGTGGTWSSYLITDGVWSNHHDIGASRGTDGRVSIAWVEYYQQSDPPPLMFITSTDAGASWSTAVEISDIANDTFSPWIDCNVHVDADGFSHVVWNAGEAGGIDPQKIYHWTDRVAGPIAGGTKSTVDWSKDVISEVDCTVSSNSGVSGKPVISECNGRLYVIWQQFGNPDFPDDCAADSVSDGFRGGVNSDIYMNVSLGLEGSLWDFRRNLTNSHTPGCDGFTDNECDHDSYASPARVGMNTAAMGTTYWSAVPEAFEVRDALDNSYPVDGYYIDVQYVNDLVSDVARYSDVGIWSNNPIKWFRLPCVPPVIEPRIVVVSNSYIHPANWVPSGTQVDLDIDIENIGNDDLSITSITAAYVDGSGWLQINTPSLAIPPASGDVISITLNPGGSINPTGTDAVGIEGYVVIASNDPNNPVDSFYINTVVTENVIQIEYATIRTGLGVPLIMSNNGNAGNVGEGGNLQFFEEGLMELDCDSQGVYLYDLSPIVMYDAATYYWGPYWTEAGADADVNMFPVPGGTLAETGSTPAYEQYTTGDFVIADSTVGMIRTFAAPSDSVSYMVEKWQIFSWNGADITGINLGEWVDMDVPSDTGANNIGTIVEADDYLFVSGQEGDPEGCTPSDARFYTTGLLGYYLQSAYNGDPGVNNTGLEGAYTGPTEDLMEASVFVPDSVWNFMTANAFLANNTDIDDKRSLLDFGSFDILATDTLVIWIMHGSILNGTETDVATQVADAKVWYMANRDGIGTFGCCGAFTGGFPGNTNCDIEGKRNLADITKLIDHVYISKADLCCNENGNVNADIEGKRNLADITKLIDHVYISKAPTPLCL